MKELKAELKRGILHGKIIYVMMMVAILFALGWTENLSQAIEFRENANVVFSSIQHVLYVLYFDRFKAVMIAVLSLLCAGSVYEDISSGFFLFQKLRVGRIERYVISKIAANMFLVTTATIGGILLFVAFVRPLMPLVGNNPQQDISNTRSYSLFGSDGINFWIICIIFYFFWVMDCILYARSLCSTCNFLFGLLWIIINY